MKSRTRTIVGFDERYGFLTTVSKLTKSGVSKWLCRCDCGQQSDVWASNLVSGHTVSCGCHLIRIVTTHGQSGTVEYKAWMNMWSRCTNPGVEDWHRYGGRGIKVCDRWSTFENFFADMGNRPGPGYSVDRKDVDGDYEPENCQWATSKAQARNTSKNHIVKIDGKSMTLIDAAEMSGITYNTLLYRIKRGWPVERAIREPVHARR